MTTFFLLRHGQSDFSWSDGSSRPLSGEGLVDRLALLEVFAGQAIDAVYSSPFRRVIDAVSPLAQQRGCRCSWTNLGPAHGGLEPGEGLPRGEQLEGCVQR